MLRATIGTDQQSTQSELKEKNINYITLIKN